MNRDLAKRIVDMMLAHAAELDESVRLVQEDCSAEEQRAYKLAIGYIFSEMYDRVIDPVLREHPDVAPEGLGYVPRPGGKLGQ